MAYPYIKAKKISYGDTRSYSSIKYIVIHYTGNNGDTAKNNADYFHKTNKTQSGAHFFVDQQGKVYRSVPMNRTAWSVGGFYTQKDGAGKYYKKCLNSNSVSIELCDCAKKDPSAKMTAAVKKLIVDIRKYCPNAKTVIRHWEVNGKACPGRMTGTNNAKWKKFKSQIAPAATVSYPTVTLQYGDTGEQVKRLQRCLNRIMKSGLSIDGSFGPSTLKAVKAFQKKYKLEVDGSVGPKTRAKIKALM